MKVTLRSGRPADAEACGRICHEAFKSIAEKHGFPPDFPDPDLPIGLLSMLLADPATYSVVAESDGNIVGSNFLAEGDSVVGIGPITVAPTVQNRGVGHMLMKGVMARGESRNAKAVRLVQTTYHMRSLALYTKLGFDPIEPLSNMQGPPINERIPGCEVRQARQEDVDACNTVCGTVHGHDRNHELREAVRRGSASVVERSGAITGYTTVVGFFGHTVAATNEDLKALISAAPMFSGPGFLLPTRNAEVLRWCLKKGLRIVQPFTLMGYGFYQEPRGAYLPAIMY